MKTELDGKEKLKVANERATAYLDYWGIKEIVGDVNTRLIYTSGFINGESYWVEELKELKQRLNQIHKLSDNLSIHPDFQKIFDLSKI